MQGGLQQTVVRIESMAGIWSYRSNFVKNLRLNKFLLRCFRDLIQVPRIEDRVSRNRENHHRIPVGPYRVLNIFLKKSLVLIIIHVI